MKAFISGRNSSKNFETEKIKYLDLNLSNLNRLAEVSYILIYEDNERILLDYLELIRQHNKPSVYLKPVFFIKNKESKSEYITKVADGVFSFNDFTQNDKVLIDMVERINNKIQNIPDYDKVFDNNVSIKILRLMFTRNVNLLPFASTETNLGYSYPLIDTLFSLRNKLYLRALDYLENNNLLSSDFFDRIFRCNKCFSAFLSFREKCVKCKSHNLNKEEVIHHFRCAYVGPKSDFAEGNNLVCPKCDTKLKLIGNDYEKPSSMNICSDCNAVFQDPNIDTKCYNCGKENIPEDLITSVVKKYYLEPLGYNVVYYGIEITFRRALKSSLDLTDYRVFKNFLNIEINRIKRYNVFKSTLCLFRIENLEKIYMDLGDKSVQVTEEFGKIVSDILRTSDIITSYNNSTFLIILTHTKYEDSKIAINRLSKSIKDLLTENLESEVTLKTSFVEIDGSKDLDPLVNEIMTNANN